MLIINLIIFFFFLVQIVFKDRIAKAAEDIAIFGLTEMGCFGIVLVDLYPIYWKFLNICTQNWAVCFCYAQYVYAGERILALQHPNQRQSFLKWEQYLPAERIYYICARLTVTNQIGVVALQMGDGLCVFGHAYFKNRFIFFFKAYLL